MQLSFSSARPLASPITVGTASCTAAVSAGRVAKGQGQAHQGALHRAQQSQAQQPLHQVLQAGRNDRLRALIGPW